LKIYLEMSTEGLDWKSIRELRRQLAYKAATWMYRDLSLEKMLDNSVPHGDTTWWKNIAEHNVNLTLENLKILVPHVESQDLVMDFVVGLSKNPHVTCTQFIECHKATYNLGFAVHRYSQAIFTNLCEKPSLTSEFLLRFHEHIFVVDKSDRNPLRALCTNPVFHPRMLWGAFFLEKSFERIVYQSGFTDLLLTHPHATEWLYLLRLDKQQLSRLPDQTRYVFGGNVLRTLPSQWFRGDARTYYEYYRDTGRLPIRESTLKYMSPVNKLRYLYTLMYLRRLRITIQKELLWVYLLQ
jgi:hypothetical protein